MRSSRNENPWLHRFAVLTAGVTVILIVAGATVTSTGSGDAVPDWPLAYGSFFPPMVGGILIEHSHRLIAGLTAALIATLAVWLWWNEPRPWVRRLGLVVLAAVLAQALLGGLRVMIISQESLQASALRLTGLAHVNPMRIAIAAGHAFLAQIVLCLTFILAMVTSQAWASRHGTETPSGPADSRPVSQQGGRWLSLTLVLFIFIQLLLGALSRHMGAGLVIPDFPRTFGNWWLPWANLPYDASAAFAVAPETFRLQVLVNFSHRVIGFLIFLLVIGLCIYSRRFRQPKHSVGRLSFGLLALTLTQIGLGALIIWTQKSAPITIAHVTNGALLLGGGVILALWSWQPWPATFGSVNRGVDVLRPASASGLEAAPR